MTGYVTSFITSTEHVNRGSYREESKYCKTLTK